MARPLRLEFTGGVYHATSRANRVEDATAWPWSSYLATCGDVKAPEWLTMDWLLAIFSSTRLDGIFKYKKFVAEGKNTKPWDDLKHQLYLGSDDFLIKMMGHIPRGQNFLDIPKPQYTGQVREITIR